MDWSDHKGQYIFRSILPPLLRHGGVGGTDGAWPVGRNGGMGKGKKKKTRPAALRQLSLGALTPCLEGVKTFSPRLSVSVSKDGPLFVSAMGEFSKCACATHDSQDGGLQLSSPPWFQICWILFDSSARTSSPVWSCHPRLQRGIFIKERVRSTSQGVPSNMSLHAGIRAQHDDTVTSPPCYHTCMYIQYTDYIYIHIYPPVSRPATGP